MAPAPLGTVVRRLRRLSDLPGDAELLERFTRAHDEAAFAGLVERHGRLVWGVCRHVLGHEHDAEDAFQATFLVLALKAGSVPRRVALGAWLHGAAYRSALQLRRKAARRGAHEMQAQAMPKATPPVR